MENVFVCQQCGKSLTIIELVSGGHVVPYLDDDGEAVHPELCGPVQVLDPIWAAAHIADLEAQLAAERKYNGELVINLTGVETHLAATRAALAAAKEEPLACTKCATIAALKMKLAAERERNRWVLVTERLPEDKGDYLVVIGDCVTVMEFTGARWFDWAIRDYAENITYWRELPQPPEADHESL